MPSLTRELPSGIFIATWRDANGQRVSVSTGETIHERALPKAAAFEAEARFWEDNAEGVWQRLADAGFSPRYLHKIFVGRAHVDFTAFRALLIEAKIPFKPAAQYRDKARPAGRRSSKTWSWRGKKRTLEDLLPHAAEGVTKAALRFRLDAGWSVDDSLSTAPMSRSESGMLGARASNQPKRQVG